MTTKLEYIQNHLVQVFQYAEMLVRLDKVQELLDVEGGYIGEKVLFDEIEKLKIEIRKEIEKHLENAEINHRARIIVNNIDFLRVREKQL